MSFVDDQTGRGAALRFDRDSVVDVDDTDLLDIDSLTIEAWIKPSEIPLAAGEVANIVSVGNQYNLQLIEAGKLHCSLSGTGKSNNSTTSVATDQWTHVACTYNATTSSSSVYVNGTRTSTNGVPSGTLAKTGTTGLSIGAANPPPTAASLRPRAATSAITDPRSRLIGLIDQVRLMNVPRTTEQICADAGRSSCPAM